MDYDRLWAPWRLAYIQSDTDEPATAPLPPGADADCFICQAAHGANDRARLTVLRGELAFTLLNKFPYNNGHLLIAPYRHVGEPTAITDAEHLALQRQVTLWTSVLTAKMRAEGFNIGLNLGRVAGAGLPGHLHWHIVPRWNGDGNFMASLAGTRVIPQALDSLWELLTESIAELRNAGSLPGGL